MLKVLLPVFLCLLSFSASAAQLERIVFFGDSLSDNGNLYQIDLHTVPKSPPYFEGRFSNGPVWSEKVGEDLKAHAKMAYSIYARGGATATDYLPATNNPFSSSLGGQVDRYLLENFHADHSQVLFSFWIGANDYLDSSTEDAEILTDNVVHTINDTVDKLIQHKARHFIFLNLPDLGKIPQITEGQHQTPERMQTLSSLHNRKLRVMADTLQKKYPDIEIIFVDVGELFDDVVQNTSKYNEKYHLNITDVSTPCWTGGYRFRGQSTILAPHSEKRLLPDVHSAGLEEARHVANLAAMGDRACDNPEQHLFWDHIHPTAVTHQIVSSAVLEKITDSLAGDR